MQSLAFNNMLQAMSKLS